MPAALARCASSSPALPACSMGFMARRSPSVHDTAASVLPATSSMSWAWMPRLERNTEMRGRSAVPVTFARTRWRRLSRVWGFVMTVMRACPPFGPRTRPRSGCPCPCRAPAGAACGERGHLARLLLGGSPYDPARGLGHLELDAVGRLDRDGVRVAQRQLEVAALEHRAVADALDLQALLETGGHALDHVGYE